MIDTRDIGDRGRPLAIGVLYCLAASVTLIATRFDGGVAFIWIANAILLAELVVAPRRRKAATVVACGVGQVVASGLFAYGPAAAIPLAAVNMGEVLVSYWVVCRLNPRRGPLESLGAIAAFVLATGVVGPALGAIGGGAITHWTGHGPFWINLLHWFAGHALGAVTVTPIATFVLRGDLRRWIASVDARTAREAIVILGVMGIVSFVVFFQNRMPLLFLPMLPLIIATFRFDRFGAAASVTILAVTAAVLTLMGRGPINLIDASSGLRIVFLQFYLAVVVLTALPVAAALARRQRLFIELRESEARYRLVADSSTDIVMTLDAHGLISYVSPSIATLAGYRPRDVLGRNGMELVHADDRGTVERTHRLALAEPDTTHIVEYRGLTASGEIRWFETHTRGMHGDDGKPTGAVSAIRDIAHRKQIEARLAQDAETDPLTGLANRRAFVRLVDEAFASDRLACVAFLDIDYFKQVNDRFGHPAGDTVLQRFAALALAAVRDSDAVARIGGEEFAILLRGAGITIAASVCERLRASVAAADVGGDHGAIRITVSTGIVQLDRAASPDALFRAADDALYRAKTHGRNRLELAA